MGSAFSVCEVSLCCLCLFYLKEVGKITLNKSPPAYERRTAYGVQGKCSERLSSHGKGTCWEYLMEIIAMVRGVGEHRKPAAGSGTTGFENIWRISLQCLSQGWSCSWQLAVWGRRNVPPLDAAMDAPTHRYLPLQKSLQCQNTQRTWIKTDLTEKYSKIASLPSFTGLSYILSSPVLTGFAVKWFD